MGQGSHKSCFSVPDSGFFTISLWDDGYVSVVRVWSSVQKKSEIFKALGHPTWFKIVEKLADGEQCVCVLLEMFDVEMSTLSRHLSVLKNAEIDDPNSGGCDCGGKCRNNV